MPIDKRVWDVRVSVYRRDMVRRFDVACFPAGKGYLERHVGHAEWVEDGWTAGYHGWGTGRVATVARRRSYV